MANVKVKVISVEVRKNSKTNQEFAVYKTLDPKTGKKIDLKFTKACRNIPTERSYLIVDEKNVNVDRSGEWPVCWVKDIVRVDPIESYSTDSGFEKVAE